MYTLWYRVTLYSGFDKRTSVLLCYFSVTEEDMQRVNKSSKDNRVEEYRTGIFH